MQTETTVTMLYRNDEAGGLGIMVKDVPVEMLRKLRDSRDHQYREAVANREEDEFVASAVEELEEIARINEEERHLEWPVVYAAIYTLITLKAIPDDEYNGFVHTRVLTG